ncbi:hypothetical protein ACIQ6K_38995 [Streptomyces sp. NPDC096354]|uniref:hypothetical protein n=1 Tax=unclassified Streptomyces TaxID=2593676 RepID=UPI002DDB7AFC|nr:hypothetical protein [Streptomyces sp. NBC_01800]WSA65568.1 hypothetical protein OIE65_00060 [Streptomyces sp. NBC_01800]WSA73549.1 hypothetical protein OIE65_46000 [Streptomyces sp. NBC_01800]
MPTASILIPVASAAAALAAVATAFYTARGSSVRAAFDLARNLYNDLTSKDTAASRSALEFFRRAESRTEQQAREVMDHYFALLWQFEKVYAGRTSLVGQRRLNGSGPAVAYLDSMIRWHVTEWAARWLDLHTKIEEQVGKIDDPHSLKTFCDLAEQIEPENEHVLLLRSLIAERTSQQ